MTETDRPTFPSFSLSTNAGTGQGAPAFLPSGELVVPITYGQQTVAALLVEDARQTKKRRKEQRQRREQQSAAGDMVSMVPMEGGGDIFSEARVGRIQEVADRVLGSALQDTLVGDRAVRGCGWVSLCARLGKKEEGYMHSHVRAYNVRPSSPHSCPRPMLPPPCPFDKRWWPSTGAPPALCPSPC